MGEKGYELFFGKKSPFSHQHDCQFRLEKKNFHCMNQYMMYKKAEVFNDEDIMHQVLDSKEPDEITLLGRQVKDFDILKWMKVAVDVVKRGNRAKFSKNESLKWKLYNTWPNQMVEASPSDTRWGIGLSADNPDAHDERKWRGRNLLGKVLTNLRDDMMMEDNEIEGRTLPLLENDQSAIEQDLLEKERDKPNYGSRDRGQNWRSEQNVQSSKFEFFLGSESPFSNYHETEFEIDGKKFCCIEHFMLYGKADLFGDKKTLETILKITRPGELKYKIDVNYYDGKIWTEHRTDIYKLAVKEKFKQNPELMQLLLATFPKIILRVDMVAQRRLESNPASFKRDEWRHWSEFALMEVRDEILGKDSGADLTVTSCNQHHKARSDKSAEHLQDETKPTKNYRKMKLRMPNEKKYTIIQNTDPLSFEAECKFTIDDVVFNSVNHYTAYKKAELFEDNFTQNKIKKATDSQVIRKLDGEVTKFDPTTWFANHVEIYKQACEAKFLQNPDLMLTLYDTYPTLIHRSGKSVKGRVTGIDHTSLSKQDRSNQQDINNVLHDVRDELMRKEGLID